MNSNSDVLKNVEIFASELLKNKLPSHLYYHTYWHTYDVVEASLRIGKQIQLDDRQLDLVMIAAWLHDVGYVYVSAGHEAKSIEIAKQFFATQDISREDAQLVYDCIKATQVPQNPPHILAEVLCDADLAHLAAFDFFERCEPLRQEWEAIKKISMSDKEWYEINANFLSNHKYFTSYGREIMEENKNKNLKKVEKKLRKAQKQFDTILHNSVGVTKN